ncbi:probable serine/threonine-protein kinase DDB_G0282963 isoform X2 [Panonychus citri]|uniref:probable serine/threonine-protein kinase DDB_G0282963 isoform X2 n=1 Tax=Panonychus citri TaxID=50023 RepID=UPI0023080A46|nr:probable serine/threonine-protein kinase DDB_G0282963 isoform X2 [Panonychus citri]
MSTIIFMDCLKYNSSYKMTPRPPFLSPFDYIFYLKRQVEKEKLENSNYESDGLKDNSYQGGLSIETPKLSELLRKLAEDLRIAQGSFVDEFIDEPHHGISWLLDLLRSSLNRQQCPGMVISGGREQPNKNKMIKNRDRQHQLKRAMTDEYDCLLCLKYATTANSKALVKILSHRNGLLTLASCIVSNLTKSRVIALELLTKVCNIDPEGDGKVLEAISTMRIIFGESVRFKLLISVLNSANGSSANGFESTVLMFLNSLLAKCPDPAERVRLQCELEEAGLDLVSLEKRIKEKSIPPDDQIWSELRTWRDKYINVGELIKSNKMLTRESNKLRDEIDLLQRALTKLEEDKINLMHIEREMKEKAEDLEAEVMLLRARLSESGIKITCRRRSKSTGRPGSDSSDPISSGAADSGRWSDSEGGGEMTSGGRSSTGNDEKTKPINSTHSNNNNNNNNNNQDGNMMKETSSSTPTTTTGSIMMNDDCIDDQNVRNEDIFIYIPSIRPPANFKGYTGSEHLRRDNLSLSNHHHHRHHNNQHTHHNSHHQNQFNTNHHQSMSSNKVKKSGNNPNGGGNGVGGDESRWRLRQRVDNNNDDEDEDDEDNYSGEESKPTVVDVYPKKNDQSKGLIKSSSPSKPSTAIKSTKISSSTVPTINSTNVILSNDITDQSINHESICSASIVGADCEDTEFTLDWQYPKVNSKLDSHGTIYLTSDDHHPELNHNHNNQSINCKQSNRKRSQSTGYLNESNIGDHSMNDKNDMRSSESWTQFLMRSRGSSMTSLSEAHSANNSNGQGRSLDPIGRTPGYGSSVSTVDPVGNGKRSGSQVSTSGKSKNLASSLQSYFFSGGGNSNGTSNGNGQSNGQSISVIKTNSSSSTSSHKIKSNEREKIKESIDSSKSFPLPNVFKKNFIAKGHANCGLYSGVTKGSSSSSTSSERSTNNVNKLVHREIAKEIGAFY